MAFDRSADYQAADAANDVYAALGRAYVEPGAEGELVVLDRERASVLRAWVETVIPGNEEWPSAADVPSVSYIDRTIAIVISLRPVVLAALDQVSVEAGQRFGESFAALDYGRREELLKWFEGQAPLVFTFVKELTYEAYYRDGMVAKVLERRTGFNTRLPVQGVAMSRYVDDASTFELLAEVAEKPSLVRELAS